jgi:hypothetical protein
MQFWTATVVFKYFLHDLSVKPPSATNVQDVFILYSLSQHVSAYLMAILKQIVQIIQRSRYSYNGADVLDKICVCVYIYIYIWTGLQVSNFFLIFVYLLMLCARSAFTVFIMGLCILLRVLSTFVSIFCKVEGILGYIYIEVSNFVRYYEESPQCVIYSYSLLLHVCLSTFFSTSLIFVFVLNY